MKKLCPYGAYLQAQLIQNRIPRNSVYVFIGWHAWRKAEDFQKIRPTTLCLSPWRDPSEFRWPVKNCDVLVFDTGGSEGDYFDRIAISLMLNGAEIVRIVPFDENLIAYKREMNEQRQEFFATV